MCKSSYKNSAAQSSKCKIHTTMTIFARSWQTPNSAAMTRIICMKLTMMHVHIKPKKSNTCRSTTATYITNQWNRTLDYIPLNSQTLHIIQWMAFKQQVQLTFSYLVHIPTYTHTTPTTTNTQMQKPEDGICTVIIKSVYQIFTANNLLKNTPHF